MPYALAFVLTLYVLLFVIKLAVHQQPVIFCTSQLPAGCKLITSCQVSFEVRKHHALCGSVLLFLLCVMTTVLLVTYGLALPQSLDMRF